MSDLTQRHWSEDFVKHLRTVHFALIAVSAGVIVLACARSTSEISTAHEKLKEIMEITGPKEDAFWTDTLLASLSTEASQMIQSADIGFYGNALDVNLHDGKGEQTRVAIDRTLWRLVSRSYPGAPASYATPASLSEFKNAWDHWRDGVDLLVFKQQGADCWVRTLDDTPHFKKAICSWSSPPLPGTLRRKGEFRAATRDELISIKELSRVPGPSVWEISAKDTDDKFPYIILIPVEEKWGFIDVQTAIIEKHPSWHLHKGTFEESFKPLTGFKEYQSTDLKTAETILAAEEKRSLTSLDAFGVKFPAEAAIRWGAGAALVLIVQLYLWAHLFEFRRKLSSEDKGWNVAWVGVYETRPARILLYGSLLVLPLAGVSALGIRGLYISEFTFVSWLLLSGSSVASVILAILICTSLPRKN